MLKVVFDTNVYISAYAIPGSQAEEAYLSAFEGKIELFTSVAILTETAGKLREKFGWEDEQITDALRQISRVAVVVRPSVRVTVLRDEPDNRILECAIHAKADLIVTGDRHLLDLKDYQGIGITRIAGFLRTVMH
jgi:putative PIN family toxin of toxin-antitoxin system